MTDLNFEPFPFLVLPIEVAILILSCFEVNELLFISQCSRGLNQLCQENIIWKSIAKKKWNIEKGGIFRRNVSSWKSYYAQKTILYKPNVLSWCELMPTGELPSKRYQHTASVVGNSIYFIGGQELPEKRFDEIYRFDTVKMDLVKVSPSKGKLPKFARHAAVTIENKIYTFGGYDGVREHFQLCTYSPDTNEWDTPTTTGDKPVSRTNHAAASIGSKMFMFGGMYKESGERLIFLDDFYELDTLTLTWKNLQPKGIKPSPRCGHRLVTFGEKLLLFGGGSGEHWDRKYNDIHIYDPALNTWSRPKVINEAPVCTFTIAFTQGPFLFLFGGQSLADNSLTSDLYVLDTINWTWTKLTPQNSCPTSRDMGSGSVVGNSMYMFGGYCGAAIDSFFMLKMSDELLSPFRSSTLSPSQ